MLRMPLDPSGTFEVHGLPTEEVTLISAMKLSAEQWAAFFAVRVDSQDTDAALPAMAGTYSLEAGRLRFQPRYPLTPGVRYRVVFDPRSLPGDKATTGEKQEAVFELPRRPIETTTVVEAIYPSADKLPENQLKFYIHFSAPMSRGEAYDHVRLLDAAGKTIEAAFLELGEELWDPAGKRFTLLFDPGRIKRGLKPREDLGPILDMGKRYTLAIDRAWSDAAGNALKQGMRKTFTVGPPDEAPIDPMHWKVQAPPAGTMAPLSVAFPEPLDHALLHRLLWVLSPTGERLAGAVKVTDGETRWQFVPERPWQAGAHRLVVDTTLEDLAGNRVGELFEVDVFTKIQPRLQMKTVEMPFTVATP